MAFIDARTLPEATEIEADLILIGGGMAGISIAREWAGAGRSVVILESGGLEREDETQALYAGGGTMRAPGNPDRNIDPYLIQSRARWYGGSGNVWGGKCAPLDPSDFAERDWLDRTGWPVTRAQMQPFYDRACSLLQIPLFDREYDRAPLDDRPPLGIGDGFFSSPRQFTRLSGEIDRAAFDEFRTGFTNAANVRVYLNANITRIRRDARRGHVSGLDIGCLNGRRHTARGRSYVLATGGIENARLMLASSVGNDNVGRCFQGHVTFGVYQNAEGLNTKLAITGDQNVSLYANSSRPNMHCVIGATLEGQRRTGLGNFTTTLTGGDTPAGTEDAAIFTLAAHLNGATGATQQPCFFMSEQLPNVESRITLLPEHIDPLGVPYAYLEWVYSERDLDLLEGSIAALGDALGASGKGRVRWPVAREALLSVLNMSRHHIGTTRISADPEFGVVDNDCRVHGVDNLYIAGSSVFPTSGIANPTLTIIAMAMRLSDHLKRQMGVRT